MSSKLYQSQSGLWGTGYSFILNFNYLFRIAYNNQPFFILNILIFGLIGFANHIKEKVYLILFLFTIAITIFHLALNIQSYHWYYSIHFLAFTIFISYGILDVVKYITSRFPVKWKRVVLLILIFVFPLLTQIELFRLLDREGPHLGYKTAGEWLNQNTPIDSKVACVEVGHIGWYSKRYIVDILGLVNPNLSKYLGEHDYSKWYELYKPDYIVVHEPLAGAELLADKYIKEGIYIKENKFSYSGLAIFKRAAP
jgi:hypothetical protein